MPVVGAEAPLGKRARLERNIRVLTATSFFSGLHSTMLYTIQQPFALSLSPSMVFVGFLQSLGGRMGLITNAVQPLSGWLSDRGGRRPFIILGSALTMSSLLLHALAGLAGSALLLIPSVALLGLAALSWPVADSLAAESVETSRRGYAYSILMWAMITPGIFSPILAGMVADRWGFTLIFVVAALIEASSFVLLLRYLVETKAPGAASPITSSELRSFVRRSVVPPEALTRFYLLMVGDAVAWGLGSSILYGMLRKTYGLTNIQLGLLTGVTALVWSLSQIPVGKLIEKHGAKASLVLSEVVGVVALLGLILSDKFEQFLVLQIPMGLVPSFWAPAMKTFLANNVSETERGEIMGRLSLFRGVLSFPAPFIGGILYDALGYSAPLFANLAGAASVAGLLQFSLHEPSSPGVDPSRETLGSGAERQPQCSASSEP